MNTAVENFDLTEYDLVISSSSAFAHGILTPLERNIFATVTPCPIFVGSDVFGTRATNTAEHFRGKIVALPGIFHTLRQWDEIASDRPDSILANSHCAKRIEKYWRNHLGFFFFLRSHRRIFGTKEHGDYFLIVSALSPF